MKQKYIQDLETIKDMMNRSSRFISLSGYSGIAAGVFALLGAYAAHRILYASQDFPGYDRAMLPDESVVHLLLVAVGTLVLAVGSGIYFTTRETRKRSQRIWDHQTRRLLINLAIPLSAGGVLCLILLLKGFIGLMAPLTLIFYGLALVNASKYTLNEIRSLGILQIALGLLATGFIGLGLYFWALGFGVLHIVYGVYMHLKYRT